MSSDPYDRLESLLPETDELGIAGYESLGPIGEGGFARVFRARQVALEREVAIKILAAGALNEGTAVRFERECRAIGALAGHPNIVEIYDCGINRWGRPYIVMDHMAGGSVGALLAESGPLDAERALEIVIKIAGAVETAHRAGILHRDIKPENILLSADEEPKLADFGVASIPGGYQTHTGAITASLAHAAPEILDGGKPTALVDVYALGSALFTMLNGSAPFVENDSGLQALIARTLTQPVPDLRNDGVDERVCAVMERAMSKDPASRYSSAADLGRALQAIQQDQGIEVTELPEENTMGTFPELEPAGSGDITLSRPRREIAPSRPLPRRRGLALKRPSVVAGALLLVASGAAALLVSRIDSPPARLAAQTPTGVRETPHQTVEVDAAGDSDRNKRPDKRTSEDRKNRARRNARGDNGGRLALAAPAIERGSGGGSSDALGTEGSTTSNGSRSSGSGDKDSADQAPAAPEPEGAERVADLVLYYHWSDNGDYYYTTSWETSMNMLASYDYRQQLGRVWSTGGTGLSALCFTTDRCEGYVSRGKPESGSYRPLYWHPGGSHGRFYSTDPTANYRGQPMNIYGWIRP